MIGAAKTSVSMHELVSQIDSLLKKAPKVNDSHAPNRSDRERKFCDDDERRQSHNCFVNFIDREMNS